MIAIIPARGGSKGLPGKNSMEFNGIPLISYTIKAAYRSQSIDRVFVSTDSEEIAQLSISFGAECPFLRPQRLATDNSLVNDTYKLMITMLEDYLSQDVNAIVALQPTSPLRTSEDIDNAINLFYQKKADSVVSYVKERHPISWHRTIDQEGRIQLISGEKFKNRQEYQPTYYPNGAIYVLTSKLIFSDRWYSENSYAYLMPNRRSIDIDNIEDFKYAENLAKQG